MGSKIVFPEIELPVSLLYQHDNFELSEEISQKSMILKEKGIPVKILNGNSEANRKYLKYSTLGR